MKRCAHCGMESMGVRSPLNNMNIITKKNITNIVCCIVSEKLAIVMLKPEMVKINNIAPKYIVATDPTGERP